MASNPLTSWQIDYEKIETVADLIFLVSKIPVDGDCSYEIRRCLLLGREAMTNLDSILESRDITADKSLYSQSYGFSSSHVQMWELNHEEGWVLKNWCFQAVVCEKTLESLLDSKEIKPVNSKENKPWIVTGRTDAEAPIPWPPDVKSPTLWKRPWCWKILKAGGEEDDRGWDGWMTLLTQWTWGLANSRRQWRTGKPGMLQSMGSQRVGHYLVTE